jgi:hypothetical protein
MVVACIAAFALAGVVQAKYVAKQNITCERISVGKFEFKGTNSWGALDVKVEDQHLFQGFRAEGTNGDKKVEIEIKSAGLGAGWKLTGKIGDMMVDGTAKQDGAFSSTWTVKAKVGDRDVEAKVDNEWDIDPAVQAAFVLFDCCDK